MTPTGSQIRAARALINWTADKLAENSGVSRESILYMERGKRASQAETMEKIILAFDKVGIEFTENEGVRKVPAGIEIFEGRDRFDAFYDYMYRRLKARGGDVYLTALDEGLFSKYRSDPDLHRRRMKELVDEGKVRVRIIAARSTFRSGYALYKKLPESNSPPTSFYAFADCFALISFDADPAPYVVLHKASPFAAAYKQAFELAWDQADPPPSLDKTPGLKGKKK